MHSYFDSLPELLKQHVAYLLVFPGQCSIRRRRLLMRWVAEGYSKDSVGHPANENAEELFYKLIELSMIQPLTTVRHMRMVLYEVSGIFYEYMVSRSPEENIANAIELFALRGVCSSTSGRRGRHLVIEKSWERDRIVFESIDFSGLRSLTVFGQWESFFISESMKVLRVIDLENASGVTEKALQKILKLLPRLKFLSLRGCSEIGYLPSSMGDLRQLQTLDIRHTAVLTLPTSITKLTKLQYIRAGTTGTSKDPSTPQAVSFEFSMLRGCRQIVGAEEMSRVGNLTALHTLGVVNVSAAGGKTVLKEVRNLTQLRKLGVSGVSKKNSKEFYSAVSGHSHLQSLSVWLNKDNQDCSDDAVFLPSPSLRLWRLQSLKIYGLRKKLSEWINESYYHLKKLNLEKDILSDDDIRVLGGLQELCVLRLRVKPLQDDSKLNFRVFVEGTEDRCYLKVQTLEIASRSSLHLQFGFNAMQNLELLKAGCCSTESQLRFGALNHLRKLTEVRVIGSRDDVLKNDLEAQFAGRTHKPAVTLEEVSQRTQALAGQNDGCYSKFPFFFPERSSH